MIAWRLNAFDDSVTPVDIDIENQYDGCVNAILNDIVDMLHDINILVDKTVNGNEVKKTP